MKYFFLVIVLFFATNGKTQTQGIYIKTKSIEKSILVRWVPANPAIWKNGIKNGYQIQRAEVENELQISAVNWINVKPLNEIPIQPYQQNDSLWKILIDKNSDLVALYNSIYPPKINSGLSAKEKKQADDNLYFLGLLICDIYTEGAKAAGLFFEDSLIEPGKKYVYRISVAQSQIKPVICFVDPDKKTNLPAVQSLSGKIKNKSVVISWKTENLYQYYSSYNIERSSDSIHFVSITDHPYVILNSQFEKDKKETFYTDTSVIFQQKYFFRISGKDHFGEFGPYSNIFSGTSYEPLTGFADVDTAHADNDSLVTIKWKLTDTTDRKKIKSAGIFWSEKINGHYSLVKSGITGEDKIIHNKPLRSNYYKIYAVDFNNDTVYSYPYFVLINDKVPPKIPEFISGESDRKGIITLKWKGNNESDLMGYRVFRSNYLNEDFTEITPVIISNSEFTDTVSLQTLTEEIYYKITAVDNNYNNSAYSAPVKISKPDIIPPAPAPVTNIHSSKNKIHIEWNTSTSEDVITTEIWRSEKLTDYKNVFSTKDSVNKFFDSTIIPDKGYYYKTVVIDDANNFTESQAVYIYNTSNVFPEIDSVAISVNRETKNISLIWKYNYSNIDKFILYRCKKGESPRFIEALPGNTFYYRDKELYIGNEYVYYIKAVFSNGKESKLSEAIEVEY